MSDREVGGFDYESAHWGADSLRAGERSIAGFRLSEILAGLPRRGPVLEVGCGAGRYLRALRELRPELELVGCDLSRGALARLAALAPEIERRTVEGPRLPAGDGEFRAVLMLDVLEHVETPAEFLDEAYRALAPGGGLHLHVPCERDPLCVWRWLPGQAGDRGLKRRFGGHVQRFRRGEIPELLARAGFEVTRLRNSLHVLGNLADVAAFVRLALARRAGRAAETTGDLIASGGGFVRAVDALLYAEARLLSRLPSWSLHVWARKPPAGP